MYGANLEDVAKTYNVGGSKGDWLQLEEGDNRIRIVSNYDVLAKHWAAGKMLGICIGKENGCPVCNAPVEEDEDGKPKVNKPQVKFLHWVIDRADGKIKIAELGWTVVEQIRNYANDDDYAFEELPPYDINVKKVVINGGKNPSDTSYTVIPSRQNTDLTQEEQEEVAKLTPIEEIVQKMKEKAGAPATSQDVPDEAYDNVEISEEDLPY